MTTDTPDTANVTQPLHRVVDHGAWEEVLTLDADDADVRQELLRHGDDVVDDVGRRVLAFGTTEVGS